MEEFLMLWFSTVLAILAALCATNHIKTKQLGEARKQLHELLTKLNQK